jgi:hypothetical protein
MKLKKLPVAIAGFLMVAYMFGCANNDDSSSIANFEFADDILLAYAHSTDYSTYKLDWIEKNGGTFAVKANQISVSSSSGLKSPIFGKKYLLIVDSSSSGRLLVYDRSTLTLAGQINLGASPQEMLINGNTAYIPLYGGLSTASATLKRVDITNLPSLSLLSDLTVGQKPSAIRKFSDGKMYIANQDSLSKAQASVSIIDANNLAVTSVNVGENPSDLQSDGTRVWSYDSKWFGGTTASLSYFLLGGGTVTKITSFASTYAPAFGGSMAFNTAGGFVLLNNGTTLADFSNLLHLFSISGTTVNSTAVDAANQYRFLGTGKTYLYKVHNGNGTTTNLTAIVEDKSGAVVTTQTFTKDSDMYFFANL